MTVKQFRLIAEDMQRCLCLVRTICSRSCKWFLQTFFHFVFEPPLPVRAQNPRPKRASTVFSKFFAGSCRRFFILYLSHLCLCTLKIRVRNARRRFFLSFFLQKKVRLQRKVRLQASSTVWDLIIKSSCRFGMYRRHSIRKRTRLKQATLPPDLSAKANRYYEDAGSIFRSGRQNQATEI